MNTAGRLAAFACALAITFTGGYAVSAARGLDATSSPDPVTPGLSSSERGYLLNPIQAPRTVGELGTLSFSILDTGGRPVADYLPVHEKQLHLSPSATRTVDQVGGYTVRLDGALVAGGH